MDGHIEFGVGPGHRQQIAPDGVGVASLHQQFVAVNGIAGQTHDSVDVAASSGDGSGGGGQHRRGQLPAQNGDGVGPDMGCGGGIDHVELHGDPLLPAEQQQVFEQVLTGGNLHHDAQSELAAYHYLLHILDFGTAGGQYIEQGGEQPGPVRSGDPQQDDLMGDHGSSGLSPSPRRCRSGSASAVLELDLDVDARRQV